MRWLIAIAILTVGLTVCAVFWGITSATMSDVRIDRASLAAELANMQGQLQDVQNELTDTQSELQGTQTELWNTQDELEATHDGLADTQNQLQEVQTELLQTQNDLANTQDELATTQTELADTEAELAAAQEQIDNLQAEAAYWQDICCAVGNILSVHFIDVGRADSILIDFGETEVLIDGGDKSPGVVQYLDNYVDGELEVMVATHPHGDHIGGLIAVLDTFEVNEIWLNGDTYAGQTYSQFMTAVSWEGAEVHEARRGDQIRAGCLTFIVLNPVDLSGSVNNNSIVLSLSYGEVDFLFTGDAEEEAEASMLTAGIVPNVEILKVCHHGSRGASSQAFVDVVQPEVAIIMVEEDNPWGAPHSETIDRLNGIGAEIYRTDVSGTILVTTNGVTYAVKPENGDVPLPVATASSNSPVSEGDTIELYGGPDGMASYSWLGPEGWTSDVQNPTRPNATLAMAGDYTLTVTDSHGRSDSNTTNVVVIPPPDGVIDIQIIDAQFDAPGNDWDNLNGEWVRIGNQGSEAANMTGWTLCDEQNHIFEFPEGFILPADGVVTIYTGSGSDSQTELYMGSGAPIWTNTGDTATLKDSNGQIIDQWSE